MSFAWFCTLHRQNPLWCSGFFCTLCLWESSTLRCDAVIDLFSFCWVLFCLITLFIHFPVGTRWGGFHFGPRMAWCCKHSCTWLLMHKCLHLVGSVPRSSSAGHEVHEAAFVDNASFPKWFFQSGFSSWHSHWQPATVSFCHSFANTWYYQSVSFRLFRGVWSGSILWAYFTFFRQLVKLHAFS